MALIVTREVVERVGALMGAGRYGEARGLAVQLLGPMPDHYGLLCVAAMASHMLGEHGVAADYARRAVGVDPEVADGYYALGTASLAVGRIEEAIGALEKLVALKPGYAEGQAQLGAAYWQACLMPEAYGALRRAMELEPNNSVIHSNMLMAAGHVFGDEPEKVCEMHREWARKYADVLASEMRPHTNDRNPERPLRIGYVSGQFRMHTGAFFLEPVLAAYDREQFKVFCYNTLKENPRDPVTGLFHSYVDAWRNVENVSDRDLVEMIRNDGIDILVDVAGHMVGHRLQVFARKPAPVQVTYIGYQETTGLKTIDYRFSDGYADPVGMTEGHFSEGIWRLPRTAYCLRAAANTLGVSELPARRNGFVTFGSTNRVSKMTSGTVALWCRVLKEVAGSRMVIRSDGLGLARVQRRVLEQFAARGIGAERLTLLGWGNFAEYQKTFHGMDVALDSFPFGGHTVTCQTLWMGVPVVSLVGRTHASRMGLSILSNVGLPELAAGSEEEFVKAAVGLARDLGRLEELRRGLRERMAASPLMDQKGFAQDIGGAYREMWRRWCGKGEGEIQRV
jgi:predicted O-linked N-acetylglucosamine transferase (SPINDLY family)